MCLVRYKSSILCISFHHATLSSHYRHTGQWYSKERVSEFLLRIWKGTALIAFRAKLYLKWQPFMPNDLHVLIRILQIMILPVSCNGSLCTDTLHFEIMDEFQFLIQSYMCMYVFFSGSFGFEPSYDMSLNKDLCA